VSFGERLSTRLFAALLNARVGSAQCSCFLCARGAYSCTIAVTHSIRQQGRLEHALAT